MPRHEIICGRLADLRNSFEDSSQPLHNTPGGDGLTIEPAVRPELNGTRIQ